MGNRNVGIKLNGYLLPRDFFCLIGVADTQLVWDVRHGCQSELSFYCARNSACVFKTNAIKSQKEKYLKNVEAILNFHIPVRLCDGEREMTVSGFVMQHRREK